MTAFSGANGDEISFELMNPVCCEISEKIAISRKIEKSWRLIGWGEVLQGTTLESANSETFVEVS